MRKKNSLRDAVREVREVVDGGAAALREARAGSGVVGVATPIVREATETVREVRGLVDATASLGRDVVGAVDEARALFGRVFGARAPAMPVAPAPAPDASPEPRLPPLRVEVKQHR